MYLRRMIAFSAILTLIFFVLWLPAQAAPALQQQFQTPTPGPDGRILYIVQEGDNCFRIAALNGITVEQLRQLNSKLDENCMLTVGQELLVGVVAIGGTPTAGPSPTPAPPTASPTPFTGTTIICVLLFEDQNGDALKQETEPAIAGGAVSVTEINGEYSAARDTEIPSDSTAYQGICFQDVPEGSYNITVGVPADTYNPTMSLNYSLEVHAGDRAFVNFGAQRKDVVVDPTSQNNSSGGGKSAWLGIIGAIFLLGGAGLGYYAWRANKPESKLRKF